MMSAQILRFLEEAVTAANETELSDGHNDTVILDADVHHDADKPWGDAIGASLLIQTVTFSGLLIVGFASCFQHIRKAQVEGNVATATSELSTTWRCMVEIVVPSFAAGALLATAVFLLIPEAFTLLGGGGHESHEGHEEHSAEEHAAEDEHHDEFRYLQEEEEEHHEESGAAWKFGTALICGFLFPILLGALFPHHKAAKATVVECDKDKTINVIHSSTPKMELTSSQEVTDHEEVTDAVVDYEEVTDESDDVVIAVPSTTAAAARDGDATVKSGATSATTTTSSDTATALADAAEPSRRNLPLAVGVLMGDVCHNLADGFFLGTAFLLCTKSLAWTIVATTVYHELAQEIADYFLLTHHCGLSMLQALALNFAAGFSVVIGVIIVFCMDLSNEAIGIILSVSAGVYLYIAVGECLPRIMAVRKTGRDTLLFLVCFVVGAVPIGLVLLNHVHCEASGAHAEHTDESSMVVEEVHDDDHAGHDHEGHDH